MAHYAKDTGFKSAGLAAPLIFMGLFIFFVYGALIIGSMGVANTLIHYYHIDFLMQRGALGAFYAMCVMLSSWAILVLICAGVPYAILRARGKDKTARLTKQAILFLMFHVFAMPAILWVVIRNSSPRLRARHVAKLRRIVLARRQKQNILTGQKQAA